MVKSLKGPTKGQPGCSADGKYGPIHFAVKRFVQGDQLKNGAGGVCEFTIKWDMHVCGSRSKSCCQSSIWNSPRSYTTNYMPIKQKYGHDCKRWYIGTLTVVNSMITAGAILLNNNVIRRCLKDGCDQPEMCDKDRCSKNPRCKWNPNANKEPTWGTEKVKTFCQAKRL